MADRAPRPAPTRQTVMPDEGLVAARHSGPSPGATPASTRDPQAPRRAPLAIGLVLAGSNSSKHGIETTAAPMPSACSASRAVDRERDLGAGGEQGHLRARPSASRQHVGAARRAVVVVAPRCAAAAGSGGSAPATDGARRVLQARAPSTRRSRPRRPGGRRAGWGSPAAPPDARPAGGSARPRRGRSNRGSSRRSRASSISAARRIAGRQ